MNRMLALYFLALGILFAQAEPETKHYFCPIFEKDPRWDADYKAKPAEMKKADSDCLQQYNDAQQGQKKDEKPPAQSAKK